MARGTAVKIRWRVGGGRRAEDPDPNRPPPPNPKPFRSKITILENSNRQSISTKWKSFALFPILGIGISKAYMRVWVFGYGLLVWNPGFEADEKAIGYIKDYRRVFDLACIDHRGTPELPARTCTLEEDEGSICWGTAYCVRGGPEKERSAMEYLRRRECKYDRETLVDFYTDVDSEQPFITGMIVFTSTLDKVSNKYYLGSAPLLEMATQIATASGPCRNNREYIFRLENALFDIGHEDEYVIELANEVRKVLGVSLELGRKVLDARLKSSLSPLALGPLQEGITTDLYLFF